MSYCDYIAHLCREALSKDPDWLLSHVGKIEWDLNEDGSFKGTTKVLKLEDNSGKKYKVIVEEA